MSKLYYTDPLKAAWMTREFGVKVQMLIYLDDGTCLSDVLSIPSILDFYMRMPTIKLYIHPDSYGIFEPQKRDRVVGRMLWRYDKGYYLDKDSKIIQRDDKAFFMPTKED